MWINQYGTIEIYDVDISNYCTIILLLYKSQDDNIIFKYKKYNDEMDHFLMGVDML